MKKPLLALTVLSLSLSSIIAPMPATAALPLSVNGEQMPSLAPMLEKVTPAVVSIAVEGTQVLDKEFQNSSDFSLVQTSPLNRCKSARLEH